MKKFFLFLTAFVISFSLFPHNYASCNEISKKNISPYYFQKALYNTGRLLSLNLLENTEKGVLAYYNRLFSKGNETLVVLMYHSFYRDSKDFKTNYSISIKDFEDELKVLEGLSFEPVSLDDVYYYTKYGKAIPERAVLLTFDDGFKTFFYIYPLIKKYDFKAVISIMTGFTGSSWSLTKEDIELLQKEGYVEFASHTNTLHNDFKKALEKKEYKKIEEDIKKSREFFNSLGIKTTAFTYPSGAGSSDKNLRNILQKYGFEIGLDTWKHQYNKPKSDLYSIARIEVSERGGFSKKDKFREFLLDYLKE